MDTDLKALLDSLADGQRHSGRELAERFGISRAAIWKRIERLRALGLAVEAVSGGGYRVNPVEDWLDADAIRSRLVEPLPIQVEFAVGSTNDCLADQTSKLSWPRVLLAETQTAGRGRRGRQWQSPPGAGLYLSLGWVFESGLAGLSGLSLAAGLAAAETLRQAGLSQVQLKWPNDLVVDGKKLGGLLVEISGSADGPCRAIIGLGLNVRLASDTAIDQPWTDLRRQGLTLDRNTLAGELIPALIHRCRMLDQQGFEPMLADWQAVDALLGRSVQVSAGTSTAQRGICRGIDAQGRLGLESSEGMIWLSGGEVSVRAD